MIIFYKNSILASIVSVLGCVCILVTVMVFDLSDLTESMPPIILGVALLVGGKLLSNHKAFKKWWEKVEEANLIEPMKTDISTAQIVYSKNPCKATLKKIAQLNPAAVEAIKASPVKK